MTPDEERVRRALRGVRSPGPVPDDVATRLEAALADLRARTGDADAEVESRPRTPPVHRRPPPAASRQRRARLLLAAAALATVAIGGGLVIQTLQSGLTGSGDEDAAGAASSAVEDDAARLPSPEVAGPGGQAALAETPVRLRSGRLGQDVERALEALPPLGAQSAGETAALLGSGCVLPPASDDALLVPARLNGIPGTLRVPVVPPNARAADRVVTAEVLACDDPGLVRDVARVVVPRTAG